MLSTSSDLLKQKGFHTNNVRENVEVFASLMDNIQPQQFEK